MLALGIMIESFPRPAPPMIIGWKISRLQESSEHNSNMISLSSGVRPHQGLRRQSRGAQRLPHPGSDVHIVSGTDGFVPNTLLLNDGGILGDSSEGPWKGKED